MIKSLYIIKWKGLNVKVVQVILCHCLTYIRILGVYDITILVKCKKKKKNITAVSTD